MGRLPNKPYNELGTGAGLPLLKRPRPVADASLLLSQPFRVPIVKRGLNAAGRNSKLPARAARMKLPQSYALMELDGVPNSVADLPVDANGDVILSLQKRARSLFHANYKDSVEKENHKLSQGFLVPVKVTEENQFQLLNGQPPPVLGMRHRLVLKPRPLHDPMGEYAIVLYDPTVDVIPEDREKLEELLLLQQQREEERKLRELELERMSKVKIGDSTLILCNSHRSLAEILGIDKHGNCQDADLQFANVPVVIDPKLLKILRPHQISGVKFLYRCTAGLVDPRAKGCIMADEMGLGKTLQCILLMWTLLRQGPRGKKTIDKLIVVCPSSLVRNWANEFDKWLGKGRLTPLLIDGKSVKSEDVSALLQNWASLSGRNIVRPVLVISYETLRRNVDKLSHTEVGLILADEGHRLKNGDSLTFTLLNALQCPRRVILSGTPIQNDLTEYFSLLSFANPGLLGTRLEFRKKYENDILRSRDFNATDKEREIGDAKLQELIGFVSNFIIRRTNDILSKYLPVKYEYVVFIKLSDLQLQLYQHMITSPEIKKLLKGAGSQPLKLITMLKKLVNHPNLLNLPEDISGSEDILPVDYDVSGGSMGRNRQVQTWFSGKFKVLERFLHKLHNETDDKIVIISNYTQTLDLVEKLCRSNRFGSLRLDGTMNINKRQKLVDRFNDPNGDEFIFLLSSKAGGCGINLIGGNRLILLDPDWNPASDQQLLLRVWRDGQTKNCFIYRFIATGTIDEKIFQRQSAKLQLSSAVVDNNEDVERTFSKDLLRKLFEFKDNTLSDTHDSYNCTKCDPVTRKQLNKNKTMLYGDSTSWNHLHPDDLLKDEDILLQNESSFDDITYLFQYISHLS